MSFITYTTSSKLFCDDDVVTIDFFFKLDEDSASEENKRMARIVMNSEHAEKLSHVIQHRLFTSGKIKSKWQKTTGAETCGERVAVLENWIKSEKEEQK